ncbi:MAG: ROK family protein [Anaerolineae bacterium]|nr:ROK family protein [Anaerolineae bacterium]
MTTLILALDFGGTKLTAALFGIEEESRAKTPRRQAQSSELGVFASLRETSSCSLLDLRRVITPDDADAAYEQAAMLALARDLLAGRAPAAVGVSFGGPVDFAAGVVRLSHHVRGWEALPLRDRLAAEFGCPVGVDNDANVAALGEHRFGAGRGLSDLMYVTVSTGVGGGWILGGRPWRGHEGMAGEIGHTVADPAGPLCLCGKRGCVERLASGPYMAADYVAQAVSLPGRRGEGTEVSGRDIAERAAAGDALARELLLRGAWALGVGIGHAANLVNPQRFILGGGVTKAGEAWWAEVRRSATATALPEVHFDIVPAALGDDAPLWGALALTERSSADGAH